MAEQSSSQQNNNRVCVARFMGPHGIRGLVKIKFFGENPALLDEFGPLYDENGQAFQLHRKNMQKDMWLVEIDGISDRTSVENLGKFNLYIDREKIRMTKDENSSVEEYFYDDLIGLEARLKKNNSLVGKIVSIQNYGAGDLIEVKNENGVGFLIPFTADVVPVVNTEKGFVLIDPLKGMIEE